MALLSVVVASRQRRRGLLQCLESLAHQVGQPSFQAIVVLDGSTDGSAEAVAAAGLPFEAMVLEQSRRGLHYARDLGASAAAGDHVFFMDDDTRADPDLLVRIEELHADGAVAVQPVVELRSGSAQTVLSRFARRWVAARRNRLDATPPRPADALAAPLSLSIDTLSLILEKTGPPGYATAGFGEDFRLGQALNAAGARLRYLADSGCQLDVGSSLGDLLERSWEMGRADGSLATEAPSTAASIQAARAERWVASEAAARAVDRDAERAARRATQIQGGLVAEARRGVSSDESLARLDEAVALEYELGRRGHPMQADRRT